MADSFAEAARRHRNDAKNLETGRRFQNAGHLIGLAAECLAKDILTCAGIVITKSSGYKEHFPKLGHQIRTGGHSRVMILLEPVIGRPKFLDGWVVDCRYEADVPPRDSEERYRVWLADVDALFKAAGVP